jgi:hypothetical protein
MATVRDDLTTLRRIDAGDLVHRDYVLKVENSIKRQEESIAQLRAAINDQ